MTDPYREHNPFPSPDEVKERQRQFIASQVEVHVKEVLDKIHDDIEQKEEGTYIYISMSAWHPDTRETIQALLRTAGWDVKASDTCSGLYVRLEPETEGG